MTPIDDNKFNQFVKQFNDHHDKILWGKQGMIDMIIDSFDKNEIEKKLDEFIDPVDMMVWTSDKGSFGQVYTYDKLNALNKDQLKELFDRLIGNTNESVRDMMTPKSEEDIENSMKGITLYRAGKVYNSLISRTRAKVTENVLKHLPLIVKCHQEIFYNPSVTVDKYLREGWKSTDYKNQTDPEEMLKLSFELTIKKNNKKFLFSQHKNLKYLHCSFINPDTNRLDMTTIKTLKEFKEILDEMGSLNESLKDYLTPKSEEDIKNALSSSTLRRKNERLIDACRDGDLDTVKFLIKSGALINSTKWTDTPLTVAIRHNQTNIVKFLIKNGANVNRMSEYGETPLVSAVESGKIRMVSLLIESGARLRSVSSIFLSPLWTAVKLAHVDIVQYLIDKGADIDYINPHTGSLTKTAQYFRECYSNQRKEYDEIIKILNNSTKGKVNESVRDLMTPRSKESMIEYLKGLSQYEKSQKLLKLNLQKLDDLDMIKYLIEAGASVNYKDRNGITVLDMACAHGNVELVKHLIVKGADVNSLDHEDRTALMAAACNGFPEIIDILIQNGADINTQNDDERTALHDAVTNRRADCVKKLLELGADVTITDDVGNTPLDLIIGAWKSESSVKIIDMLKEKEKEHNRPINRIKRFLNFNESIRDFLKPKSKDEIKQVLDKLPERERLVKGIKMDVYDDKDVDEMLGGLSPREYFIRSMMIEKSLPVEKRRLVTKAMSLIKPYKKVKIGDLLTVPPTITLYGEKTDIPQPLLEIVQKITFFNRDEFHKFIKEYQEDTKNDVMSDEYIKHIYQTNSWKKVNCVIVVAKNRNKHGSFERRKNTYIVYDYGKTTGVFQYTKNEIEEYESQLLS
jgi:ankyrin repeat protein